MINNNDARNWNENDRQIEKKGHKTIEDIHEARRHTNDTQNNRNGTCRQTGKRRGYTQDRAVKIERIEHPRARDNDNEGP